MAYADDFDGPCEACGESPKRHAIPSITQSSAKLCADIIKDYQERTKKTKSGFMVGAMVAACGATFGARSGKGATDFDASVSAAGATPVSPNGLVTVDQAVGANTSVAAAAAGRLGTILRTKWTAIFNNLEDKTYKKGSGYNYPGSCAGAKLLANSGHKPVEMTEMYFQPKGVPHFDLGPYKCRSNGIRVDERTYSSAGEIGSCNTCQDLLYLTMCPERTC